MKKLLPIIAAVILLTGCKTSSGPALLQAGVTIGTSVLLRENPDAMEGVQIGASVICSVANGTDLSPLFLTELINSQDLSPDARFILHGVVTMYTLTYNGIENPDLDKIRPYALATCNGLNLALAQSGSTGALSGVRSVGGAAGFKTPKAVTQDPVWPQVKFKE